MLPDSKRGKPTFSIHLAFRRQVLRAAAPELHPQYVTSSNARQMWGTTSCQGSSLGLENSTLGDHHFLQSLLDSLILSTEEV